MTDFVLVHGSWMGSWAWERLLPLLNAVGRRATAADLPGYGADTTPAAGIALQSYADKVLAAVDQVDEPVVLVGHSMGGIVETLRDQVIPIAAQRQMNAQLPGADVHSIDTG